MTEQEARERVKDLKSFYGHMISYLMTNAGLFSAFLLAAGPEALVGPLLVALGWGSGLVIHAVRVFGLFGFGSPVWEEQKVRELLRSSEASMTKEELATVLRQALGEVTAAGRPATEEKERMLQRLEHLEAIVTSEDWDLLEQRKEVGEASRQQLDLDTESSDKLEDQVSRLAGRVR